MSNTCLVTKLRSVVDNPSLEYFDALQFKMDVSGLDGGGVLILNGSTNKLLLGGPGAKFIILSNGEIRVSGSSPGSGVTEYVIPVDWSGEGAKIIYAMDATKPIEFLIIGLANIQQLALNYPSDTKIELRDPTLLKFCTALESFTRSSAVEIPIFRPYREHQDCDISDYIFNFQDKADVTALKIYDRVTETAPTTRTLCGSHAFVGYDSLKLISRAICVDYGRLSDFAGLTALTSLALGVTGSQRGVEGVLTDIAALTSLTLINMNNTKVSGSLEDFAAAQYEEGRVSASRIHVYGPYLTYDDDGETKSVGTSGVYLSWSDSGEAPVVTVELT